MPKSTFYLNYDDSKKVYYDYGTRNMGFKDYVLRNKSYIGLSFPIEVCLTLRNPNIADLDPYSEELTDKEKRDILNECMVNPWYYLREVARDSDGNYFTMDHGKFAATFCALHNINFYYHVPEVCRRTDYVKALVQMSNIISYGEGANILRGMSKEDASSYNFPKVPALEHVPSINSVLINGQDFTALRGTRPTIAVIDSADNDSYLKESLNEFLPLMACMRNQITHNSAPSFCVITGNPSMHKATYHIENKCLSNPDLQFDMYTKDMGIYERQLPSSMEFMYIDFDLIELGCSFDTAMEQFLTKNGLTSPHEPTLPKLEAFTSEVLMKRYMDLDIIDKLEVNKTYVDLVNRYVRSHYNK